MERRRRERREELRERLRGHERLLAELERFERGEPEIEERAQESDLAEELVRLEDREVAELRDVVLALRKLRDGGYGVCERCRGEIAGERLEALLAARFEVDELAFPSSGRSAEGALPNDEPEARSAREVREETEDVYESDEGGLVYSPPDRGVPPPRRE
jgi:DnaK suppressor protein